MRRWTETPEERNARRRDTLMVWVAAIGVGLFTLLLISAAVAARG